MFSTRWVDSLHRHLDPKDFIITSQLWNNFMISHVRLIT